MVLSLQAPPAKTQRPSEARDRAPRCSASPQGSDTPGGWRTSSWGGHGSKEPPPPSSHTHTHTRTHLQARRSLGSCRASKTLEKSVKSRGQGSELPFWAQESTRTRPGSSVGTDTCPPPTRQCTVCHSPGHQAVRGLRGHPVGERKSLTGGRHSHPTREIEGVPRIMGVGHRMGERRLRTLGYSPLGQGPPLDLADPGQRKGAAEPQPEPHLGLRPGGPPPHPRPSQARITPCPRTAPHG